jgi:hypothetical protein
MKYLLSFSVLFTATLFLACESNSQNWLGSGITGEGQKVTTTLDVSDFRGIGLGFAADVYLTQGQTQSVKIEAQQNIIDNIERKVEDGYWKIRFDKNVRKHDGVKIWITVPTLDKASVSGSGSIVGESAFTGLGDLSLAVSGSGNIKLDAHSKSLQAAISGSGDMSLAGDTRDCSISVSGSGDVEAFGLSAKKCSVRISGSGDVSVQVSDDLKVSIAGSGDVYYKGQPKVKSKISGSGDVLAK